MGLILLSYPSVVNSQGVITECRNVQAPGSQGLDWTYEQIGGWWQGGRHYTNTLRVTTNSAYVGPIQIQQFLIGINAVQGSYYRFPLPEYGGNAQFPLTYPGITEQDTGSFLHTIRIKQETEDGKQWLCTFEYGPFDVQHEIGISQAQSGSANPLDMAPEATWSSAKFERSTPTDVNGSYFINTVGDPLENPPKREESTQVLQFSRNEATYNEQYAQSYRDTTNQDPFLGFQPNQVKCNDINAKRVYTADYGYYWQVNYEFAFRVIVYTFPDGTTYTQGWEELVLNAGFQYYNTTTMKVTKILDPSGAPVSAPIALTTDGQPLNPTWEPGAAPGTNPQPVYLVFQQYPMSTFANLNIPQDVLTANQ